MSANKSEYHTKYYKENKEKYLEYQKEYINNPEVKKKRAERERERRKKPEVREYHKNYMKGYKKNKGKQKNEN